MKHSIIKEYEYHNWANIRIFDHLKELPGKVYYQEIKSVFSSIQEVLLHIYQVDGMWLNVISGAPFSKTMEVIKELKEKSGDPDLEGIEELYSEVKHQFEIFLQEQDDLDKSITVEHPRYGKLNTTISELVKHVINHGTYHRGNITAMLHQQGHSGVSTDYVFYLYEIQRS